MTVWRDSSPSSQFSLEASAELYGFEPAVVHQATLGSARALDRAQGQLSRLLAVSAGLAGAVSPLDVASVALFQTVAALEASSGVFAVVDQPAEELRIVADYGYPAGLIDPWRCVPLQAPVPMAEAATSGQLILIGSLAEADERYPHLHELRSQMNDVAWATIPLVRGARTLGVMTVSFTSPQLFPADVRDLLIALAQQCAQALERAWLYDAEQQARKAAELAVRERDNLIAVLSHDLKNPLTTILGRTLLLQRQASGEQPLSPALFQRGLGAIHTAAVRMREQIDDLLEVSQLQAGQQVALQHTPVDLAGLIVELSGQLARSERHQITLSGVEAPKLCVCDRRRIERVVANLLENAVKYSPEGGDIQVQLVEREHDGEEWFEVVVADSGIGIPASEIKRIFEPYFRASNSTDIAHGTGLGLASARQVVEQHGGTLTVVSIEGVGTTFALCLPRAQVALHPPGRVAAGQTH